jgi:hypothetical protein
MRGTMSSMEHVTPAQLESLACGWGSCGDTRTGGHKGRITTEHDEHSARIGLAS